MHSNSLIAVFLLAFLFSTSSAFDDVETRGVDSVNGHPKDLSWRAPEGIRRKRYGGWGGGYYPYGGYGGYGGGYRGYGGYGYPRYGGYKGYGGNYGSSSWGSYSSYKSGGFNSYSNSYW